MKRVKSATINTQCVHHIYILHNVCFLTIWETATVTLTFVAVAIRIYTQVQPQKSQDLVQITGLLPHALVAQCLEKCLADVDVGSTLHLVYPNC